jgi:hypothetical protein
MKMKGRVINGGNASGEALVLDVPFSFIGDFDPETGKITIIPFSGKAWPIKFWFAPQEREVRLLLLSPIKPRKREMHQQASFARRWNPFFVSPL